MPDLPAEPAGQDLPALVAALRAANARLREVIEAKDMQLAAAGAGGSSRARNHRRCGRWPALMTRWCARRRRAGGAAPAWPTRG